MTKLRWGILGAANIARKNWKALFHSGNNIVATVAARDVARGEQFVRECQAQFAFDPAPKVLGSYDQLLASPDVEAVYIPLPTTLRKKWVIRAAQAGKHVLCEKPCGVSATDLREMIAACQKHRVQFMDGVMFMHSPRLAAVRAVLDDKNRIGAIRRIESTFSFAGNAKNFSDNIRLQGVLEPAGCLGDLGWYCIRITLFALHGEMPVSATGRILAYAADGKTPTQFSGELIFASGASAGFYCSFVIESQQWVSVMGERGTVRIADFVHPQNSYEPEFEVNLTNYRVHAETGASVPVDPSLVNQMGHATAQDTRMFQHFAGLAHLGKIDEAWPEMALKTQLVMDACLASARAEGKRVAVEKI